MQQAIVPKVDVRTAADLLQLTDRSVQLMICSGKLEAQPMAGSAGRGGIAYGIALDALPAAAQLKYFAAADGGGAPLDADLIAYRDRYGEDGLRTLLDTRMLVITAKGIRESKPANLQRQLRELADARGVSLRTLYRWEDAYAARGLAGLMRRERADKQQPRTMCLEARRYIWQQYLEPQRRTQEAILDNARERARELGANGCERCPFRRGSENRDAMVGTPELAYYPECGQPGGGMIAPANRAAVNRAIEQISDEIKCYMRTGRKGWEAAYMYKNSRKKPDMVNECWFGDHHQFDVFAINADGKPVRPWLTALYDIGSGQLVGYVISECPNSGTIITCFEKAALRKAGSDIMGIPVTMYVDNGKDYRCERLEGTSLVRVSLGDLNQRVYDAGSIRTEGLPDVSMYDALGVRVTHAQAFHGWAKPIERWFRTLEERYCRELPGYCGGSPEARPENFERTLKALWERGELLTMDELFVIFRDKILPAYNAKPHSGYNGETPAERYARLPKARMEIPSMAMMAMFLDERKERKVTTMGVRLDNRTYWSPELLHLIGQWVVVRYNRDDRDSVTICTMGGRDKPSRFVCLAEPKPELRYVEDDAEKVKRAVAIPRIQEAQLRGSIAAMGVKLPGKRASGHIYSEALDMEYARGNITSLDCERITAAREDVKQRCAVRAEAATGQDRVSERFRREGSALMERLKNA